MAKKDTKSFELPKGTLYPLLPLRDIVLFPHMIVPLFIGREKSINALKSVMEKDQKILIVTQKDPAIDDVQQNDLHPVGTVARILQLLRLHDGTIKALVEGVDRAQVLRFSDESDYFQAYAEVIPDDPVKDKKKLEVLKRTALSQFENYIQLSNKLTPDVHALVSKIEDPHKLVDSIISHISIKIETKQRILELTNLEERFEQVCHILESELEVLKAEKKVRRRVKKQMEKSQREYYLTEQMKAIQRELGEGESGTNEADAFEDRINKTKLSKEAKEKGLAEVRKLRTMNPMSSEATVVRNYLEWLLDIPWKQPSKVKNDLKKAREILDRDHYGLEKVKERIVEYLAVQKRVGKIKGPILCLMGPPGVGKTSLGRSIAEATGREFVRISLGGVRDEADIRGHRRTYIGSMPGKVIQGMKKAGKSNPLFLLDEIDKMSSDWRGDPSSAMLEVLDPEQNSTFNDHYLEVDYDLSDVLFFTTANSLNMPGPLRDRMEIIHLSGYTEAEKVEIAKRHLIPKQMELHGLEKKEFQIADAVLHDIIRHYTREAGVRNLEREISKLARKAVTELSTSKKKSIKITTKNLADFSGVPRFDYGQAEQNDLVGVTTGLAWTEVGGDLLNIEATISPGKGKLTITGKLGDVMQESVQAATSFVRSRSIEFGIIPPVFEKRDIHVHVPEGATPKDGPSAGTAILTSLVSVLTNIPVHKDIAMTGEITLRGHVLPIGGLKEKLLAAHRGGIKRVLIPHANEKDLPEIPENVKEGLTIIPVKTATEVLKHALVKQPSPITWEEDLELPLSKEDTATDKGVTAH